MPAAKSSSQPTVQRFRPGAPKGNTLEMLSAMWDGFCLRCPSCRQGAIYETFTRIHTACPVCGAPFERDNEGDFLGAMVTAYSLAVIVAAILTVLLYVFTSLPVGTQILIVGVTSLSFLLIFYRNLKGVWIAILLALLRWFR